jgi:antitoxin ParD1/3/4
MRDERKMEWRHSPGGPKHDAQHLHHPPSPEDNCSGCWQNLTSNNAPSKLPPSVVAVRFLGAGKLGSTLNLSLTDELRSFIDRNCGDGTLYATPSEFVRQVLREKKERIEAAQIRDAILDGYQDAVAGRTVAWQGDLRQLLKKAGQ